MIHCQNDSSSHTLHLTKDTYYGCNGLSMWVWHLARTRRKSIMCIALSSNPLDDISFAQFRYRKGHSVCAGIRRCSCIHYGTKSEFLGVCGDRNFCSRHGTAERGDDYFAYGFMIKGLSTVDVRLMTGKILFCLTEFVTHVGRRQRIYCKRESKYDEQNCNILMWKCTILVSFAKLCWMAFIGAHLVGTISFKWWICWHRRVRSKHAIPWLAENIRYSRFDVVN